MKSINLLIFTDYINFSAMNKEIHSSLFHDYLLILYQVDTDSGSNTVPSVGSSFFLCSFFHLLFALCLACFVFLFSSSSSRGIIPSSFFASRIAKAYRENMLSPTCPPSPPPPLSPPIPNCINFSQKNARYAINSTNLLVLPCFNKGV